MLRSVPATIDPPELLYTWIAKLLPVCAFTVRVSFKLEEELNPQA
jgi:hypothetical protein